MTSTIHINSSFLPVYIGGLAILVHISGRFFHINLLSRISYWLYLLTTLVTTFTCAFGGASIRAVESAPGIDTGVVKTHAWTGMGVFLLTVIMAYISIRAIRRTEGKYNPDKILLLLSTGFLILFTISTIAAFRIR